MHLLSLFQLILHGSSECSLKIQGVMKLSITDTAHAEVPVFLRSYTLWSKPSQTPSPDMCPRTLLFEDILPLTYEDGGHTYDLPPTYKVQFPNPPGLGVDCSYNVTVCVTKSSDSRLWRSHIRDKSVESLFPSRRLVSRIFELTDWWQK